MKGNERIEKFLELQNKNINIDDIAKEIGITTRTLRSFLNKNGYKLENGKYILKEENPLDQIAFTEMPVEEKKTTKRASKKSTSTKEKEVKENKTNSKSTKSSTKTKVTEAKITKAPVKTIKTSATKVKKDRKINLTQEDMDKLCEVYDWYLQVKDYKTMKPKKTTSKKDINIEEENLKDLKSTSIRVEKNTWEEFERLCSNSKFSKQEIITQALKDFMKEYKHLL